MSLNKIRKKYKIVAYEPSKMSNFGDDENEDTDGRGYDPAKKPKATSPTQTAPEEKEEETQEPEKEPDTPEEDDTHKRKLALADFLEFEDLDEIDEGKYGDNLFSVGKREYFVLTDDEADEKAKEYVEQSLAYFRAEYLSNETGLPEEVFEALAAKDDHEAVKKIIEKTVDGGFDAFADDAIRADGRGHFIASYDSNEEEWQGYFIYRVN